MKPISLTLRGAIGIHDGLGLEDISIDFTRFDAGLIALVGPNGSGKTTILENLHPYRQLASREGALQNHFRLRDSSRQLSFSVGGHLYRSVINIDAHTGKQEAYLYRDTQPMNDGKTTTYDVEIEKLLGSADLFFRSIFSCQGAESITSLTAGKRKELFIELLGLQRYELYAGYAKGKADEQEKELQLKQGRVDQIQTETAHKMLLVDEVVRSEGQLKALVEQVATAERLAEESRTKLSGLELNMAENESYKKLLAKAKQDLVAIELEKQQNEATYRHEMNEITGKREPIEKEITRKREIVSHANEINARVDELLTLRIEEKDLASAKERLHLVEQEESAAKLTFQKANSEHTQAVVNQKHKIQLTGKQRDKIRDDWQAKLQDMERKLDEANKSAGLIGEVPFGQKCVEAGCKFVAVAQDAKLQIPTMKFDISLLQEDPPGLTTVEREIAALESALKGLQDHPPANGQDFTEKKAAVRYNAVRHGEVLTAIRTLESKRWEQLQKELEIAKTVIGEKEAALSELKMQAENAVDRRAKREKELDSKIADKRQEIDGIDASISDKVDSEYQAAASELKRLLAEAQEMRQQQISLAGDVAAKRSDLERLDTLSEELAVIKSECEKLGKDIEHWRLLQRACSKDGIPALELDAAGPEVSRRANELLSSTGFGTRHQIAFETTKLTKDRKKQIETFDIRVFGEEGEKRIEDLSGGQRVWIEKALQEAIAIYLSDNSGKEYLTSYADEADGALDPDNKQNFLEMLRESFKLGRRHFTLLITQTPEIYQQIQQRIVLHPETSSVECVY